MADVAYLKGHGLGNDYLVVDARNGGAEIARAHAVALCDRHRGIGSDGVLIGDPSRRPFHLRIVNPDGSEAEKSGNGLRIFGAFLLHRGAVERGEWFDVELSRDTVQMRVEDELENGASMIRVRMGPAVFDGAAVDFREPGETRDVELDLGDAGSAAVNTVSLGNPHCVVFVDELERDDFLRRAPRLCTHEAFAKGTNVQFARPIGPSEIEVWIWERGAGETLASGSSACAAAAAAVRRGVAQAGQIQVRMPGGSVEVTVGEDWQIELLGPALIFCEGTVLEGRL